MNENPDLTQLPDGLGLMVRIDGTRPLAELTALLNSVCDEVENRGEKSVVVLRLDATPADVRAWPGAVAIQQVNRWERAVRRLERLTAMTIAAARGACGGPALDLLLAADFRIGAPDLLLMLPVNDGHFWPGMSVYRLVRHLGLAKARQIVIWGNDISVDRTLELGLIDQISEDVAEAVHTATVLMGRISDQELTIRRLLLLEAGSADYDDAVGVHLAACDRELRRLRQDASAATPGSTQR
ncbi:enoyl-CoA-hydratase DpgB [Streptomyces sp. CBMA123]|uniref:enoyl-CoA-hydratase DpgB n=1 Tax=Streptomyces sp. CBMA123 TaxID=1896313 RepID=UPI001661DEC1|nr:enoyl-CoA-hydratase DpgB [Streptomyces sp. CBMA123]MBD0689542.1 enoyl-CoA hydratase [Streptomyces sp. CBMA123]